MTHELRFPLSGGLEVRRIETLSEIETEEKQPHWSEKFKYDQYDWNDPEFVRKNHGLGSYVPILLTQGYFMMVCRRDYRLAAQYHDGKPKKWHAKVLRDPEGNVTGIYACRGGRRREGEPKSVYAHKELKGCILVSGIVDHKNGWGLDNRAVVNLSRTTYGVNGSNTAFRKRTKNHGLPRGVELVRKGPKKGWFRGIRAKRLGPHRVHVFRSKRVWPTPEPAARWYQNQLKRLYNGRKSWAHNPTTVNFPIFPPLLEAELSTRSHRLREISRSEVHHDVPF